MWAARLSQSRGWGKWCASPSAPSALICFPLPLILPCWPSEMRQRCARNGNMKGIMRFTGGMGILRKSGRNIPIQQATRLYSGPISVYLADFDCLLPRLISPSCSNSLRPNQPAIHFRRLIARILETGGETANDKGSTDANRHSQYGKPRFRDRPSIDLMLTENVTACSKD
ncbi:hypothetical protein F5Y14DRAFT_279099 [Nemania sp. NC0429]|nr:hypothetical protein F5Y14DRAFT_279099 [Nemania sp. NC0429]